MDTVEGDAARLRMDTVEGDSARLRMETVQGDAARLRIDTVEGDSARLRMDTVEGDSARLNMDNVEGDAAASSLAGARIATASGGSMAAASQGRGAGAPLPVRIGAGVSFAAHLVERPSGGAEKKTGGAENKTLTVGSSEPWGPATDVSTASGGSLKRFAQLVERSGKSWRAPLVDCERANPPEDPGCSAAPAPPSAKRGRSEASHGERTSGHPRGARGGPSSRGEGEVLSRSDGRAGSRMGECKRPAPDQALLKQASIARFFAPA
jgi:hypothetical protein